eukprot:TRINITY_DN6689_c0_g1_i1.p1 TRINITY_DN6689_c0_g1~~TRINITY_DN6689_c0_g1_i1.p1  ORF type:complete len:781 (+),score=153.62 TRINITY_DN6689_c0_g1_i1:78-2345(+)
MAADSRRRPLRRCFAAIAVASLVPALQAGEPAPVAARDGAQLLDVSRTPLRTSGRYIVDRMNDRVKWACVNWHGLEQQTYVPGGLDVVPIAELLQRVVDLGFNCVRITISVEAVLVNPAINDTLVKANPDFQGLRWRQVFHLTMEALREARLMVIVDRHMLKPGNNPGRYSLGSGQWHGMGISKEDNIRSLEILAEMTRGNPFVVAFEPINEPHDYNGSWLTWGGGDPDTDLHLYYETAGKAILDHNPNVLIVVDGMCASKTFTFLHEKALSIPGYPNRIVYSPHTYVFFLLTGIMSSNSGNLWFLTWWSWPFLEKICFCIAAVSALAFFALRRRLLRRCPEPYGAAPPGAWLAPLAAWFAFCNFCVFVFAFVVWYNQKYGVGYCGYVARTELARLCLVFGLLTALGAIAAFAGGLVYLRAASAREPHLEEPFLDGAELGSLGDRAAAAASHAAARAARPGDGDANAVAVELAPGPHASASSSQAAAAAAAGRHLENCSTNGDGGAAAESAVGLGDRSVPAAGGGGFRFLRNLLSGAGGSGGARARARDLPLLPACGPGDSAAEIMTSSGAGSGAAAARPAQEVRQRWNRSLCCLQHSILLSLVLTLAAIYGGVKSHIFASDWYLASEYDRLWGFVLQDNQPYTGPVFVSEFGSGVDSEWFQRTVRYLGQKDLDWGYWPLNPVRPRGGIIDAHGYRPGPDPDAWIDNTWSVLGPDWRQLRHSWMLERLRPIMRWPATSTGDVVPCPRESSLECSS